jgi:hypothetical protein
MNIEMLEKIAKKIPVASKAGIRPSVPDLMPFLIEFLKEYEQSKENKELDELKAHCEKLRNCLMKASAMDADRIGFEMCLGKTLASTPQQSLAEIKAQAIEEAINEIGFIECAGKIPAIDLFDLREYVNQLREQAK